MPKPDAHLIDRHPALVRFFERAKLHLRAGKKAAQILVSLLSAGRYRQIWCPYVTCIDRPPRNFSVLIYAFCSFNPNRKAAFEIVEVCRVGTVIPNDGTAIDKVRVA